MHEEVFRALENGATVVTATHRLARVLTTGFHSRQRNRGARTWRLPNALTQDAFFERLWNRWMLGGSTNRCPRLLEPLEEQIIWEQVIHDSPEGDTLLQIAPTAKAAMNAWRLILAYRLPLDGRFDATEDWAAFRGWSTRFSAACETNGWLERARLSDIVLTAIRAGEILAPSTLLLAGFDCLTPQAEEFFEMCGARRVPEPASCTPAVDCRITSDATHEIRSAAIWARDLLEHDPETRIGIIVPDLASLRTRVGRLFGQTLDPGGELSGKHRPFHISLGPPFESRPMVYAALLMLEFAAGPLTLPKLGLLLRSPFLGGADAEASKRALFDASLRKRGVWEMTSAEFGHTAATCPMLQRALQRFQAIVEWLPEKQSASDWGRTFSRLLAALGWPGDRPLGSHEHQLLEKWRDLLSQLAALDITDSPQTLSHVLHRLRQIARETPFQVEDAGAPIQIMGVLEATGLRFDHLWVMGMHDQAFPKRADPNPFLPISLQREHKLPHSSAQAELEFAGHQIERLLASAPDVVMSYSERDGDQTLAASPVARAAVWRVLDISALTRTRTVTESLKDSLAPPVNIEAMQTGGSSLFKDMAACPFRAFAKHRLHAYPLEESTPGLGRKDQGTAVHKALELIWRELGSHGRLCELTAEQLRELIARNVDVALKQTPAKFGQQLERRRLLGLLTEWLDIERSRAPFAVSRTEHQSVASIGGLGVHTRADRVDLLPDGRELVIDYKTGKLGRNCWEGDRPDEPQLPLYCVAGEGPIAGAAFALLRAGDYGFRGLAEHAAALHGMKKTPAFGEQVAEWKRVLEALAETFRAGIASVDPKRGACDNCGLTALCRIQEFQDDRG